MTLHVIYDHECGTCGALYIPYDDAVPCPKCGVLEPDRFDFISEAVASLQFNKANGAYTPPAWGVGSLGDHILALLFPLFDAYDDGTQETFQQFAETWLKELTWEDQEYLVSHILGIAIRLRAILDESPE